MLYSSSTPFSRPSLPSKAHRARLIRLRITYDAIPLRILNALPTILSSHFLIPRPGIPMRTKRGSSSEGQSLFLPS